MQTMLIHGPVYWLFIIQFTFKTSMGTRFNIVGHLSRQNTGKSEH